MALSAAQHACRDRILTQAHPARIGNTVDAVVLKHGRLFMLADDRGDVPWRRPHGYGLFDGDTRVLDGFVLEIDGQPPTVLSATDTRGFEARHDLTNPELPQAGGGVLPCNTIAIRRERLIRGDVVHELLSVRNYGPGAARLTLSLRFRSRFEDIFIIKRFVRGPRGHVRRPRPRRDRVELAYDARDGARCTTVLASRRRPSDSPASAPSSSARWPRASAARSASASPPASSASTIASPVTPARRPRSCGAGSRGSTSAGWRARPRCARRMRSSTALPCARSWTSACCARACTGTTSFARACRGSRRSSAATRPRSPSRRCRTGPRWPARRCACSRATRRRPSTSTATPSPARSCTSCAPVSWQGSARFPSRPRTTARWTRRLSFSS